MAGPHDGNLPCLTYYLPSDEYRTGQSVLVLPGGGYGIVSTAKEGHRPAQFLAAHGIAAAVLEYRHAPQRYPVPLLDAQRAVRVLRQCAAENGLDVDRTGAMGFSAGGHLCGLLATQPPFPEAAAGDALDALSARPDFAAPIYSVVSLAEPWSHFGSRDNLLGSDAPSGLPERLSIEKAVNAKTPPMYLAHGQNDLAVPVENALALYAALNSHGIPATMHLYEDFAHGIGLGANHPWAQAFLAWLADR
ncbi:MAG: alpha/beta hydrolase [Opitutales bacterium]